MIKKLADKETEMLLRRVFHGIPILDNGNESNRMDIWTFLADNGNWDTPLPPSLGVSQAPPVPGIMCTPLFPVPSPFP